MLLGIGDDLLDIRWRHKIFIPAIASIPLLVVYFVDYGVTSVSIPLPLRFMFSPGQQLLDLGWLYYAYMAVVAIFCPNSINIFAGINGIEVAQSVVIACLLLANDALYLLPMFSSANSLSSDPPPATDSHLFSTYLLLPLLSVSLALLSQNWYPARVFVGDTYCYFAGMVFAIVGILGHFSKTLLLLFIPQIANFLYSAPQLFRIIDCPRHRLPHFNNRSGLLEPSYTVWAKPPPNLLAQMLHLLHKLKLLHIKTDSQSGIIQETSNFTLLNLWLVWFGPMREDRLALALLGFQLFCGIGGLFIRHKMALLVFASDNRTWSEV